MLQRAQGNKPAAARQALRGATRVRNPEEQIHGDGEWKGRGQGLGRRREREGWMGTEFQFGKIRKFWK